MTFFLYGLAMTAFALFITTLCRKSRVAVLFGVFVFIFGLLFQQFVFSSSFVGYIWWDAGTAPIIAQLLSLLPFFNFGKLVLDVSQLTTGKLDALTETYIAGPGLSPWYIPLLMPNIQWKRVFMGFAVWENRWFVLAHVRSRCGTSWCTQTDRFLSFSVAQYSIVRCTHMVCTRCIKEV